MSENKTPPMLTHLDEAGLPRMVDVGSKAETERVAIAKGAVYLQLATFSLLMEQKLPKGDAFQIARLAGIMGAKRTADLIPLCHPLPLTSVEVDLAPGEPLPDGRARIVIEAKASCVGRTGVEMEAMTAVSIAALTLYDMVKAVDRSVEISEITLYEKRGGKSGHWVRGKK
jgi:cyclic pyranopterin monophosphate synthase